jgi:hypothetical protein
MTELRIIKNLEDTVEFINWLRENRPEYVQGWEMTYYESGHIQTRYMKNQYVDAVWVWKNRGIINDWIRTAIERLEA